MAGNVPSSGLVIVYTGEGKGKTSAGLGLVLRALGYGHSVAFLQFIKQWRVSEDQFFDDIKRIYGSRLYTHKGGRGFYQAGPMSAPGVSDEQHRTSAQATLALALDCVSSGDYDLVCCDEINNAIHDGLLSLDDLDSLLKARLPQVTLCLTGRNFPSQRVDQVDTLTSMQKIKHPYDTGRLAQPGVDY